MRAVAVLAVLGFHAFPEIFPGGFAGVDVFFVISGYLISSIIWKGMAAGSFSFGDFYIRRIRRIFPALALVLAVSLVAGYFLFLSDEYKKLGQHSAAGILFYANFTFWRESGYFDTESDLKPLLHLWSLGIEEQFYLLWPLLLWAIWRRKAWLPKLLLGLLLASFATNLWLSEVRPVSAFFLPQARFWELLAGAALAVVRSRTLHHFVARLNPDAPATRHLASLLGMGLLLAAIFGLDGELVYPAGWALLPVLGAWLVIFAGPHAGVNRLLLSRRPVVRVGLISYPLYLWHWPLLAFPRVIQGGEIAPWQRGMAIAAAFLLAWLTYRFLEKQVRFRPGPLVTRLLVGVALIVAVAGHYVRTEDGLETRFAFVAEAKILFHRPEPGSMKQCRQWVGLAQGHCIATPETSVAGRRTLLLLGDSHARALATGIGRLPGGRPAGYELLAVGREGCLPFLGIERGGRYLERGCATVAQQLVELPARLPTVDTIVLVSRYALHYSGYGFGDKLRSRLQAAEGTAVAGAASNPLLFEQGLRDTLRHLTATGKRIVFMHQVPELGFSTRRCFKRPLADELDEERCVVDLAVVRARQAGYREVVNRVLTDFPGVLQWDPLDHLCINGVCRVVHDGKIVFQDDDHLNAHGGGLLLTKLVEWLEAGQ